MNTQLNGQFLAFHAKNPHVYEMVRELAFTVKRSGKRRFGIGAIFERLRWMAAFETFDDTFKLNNNYRAFYVRMLLTQEAELAEFFEMRTSVADQVAA